MPLEPGVFGVGVPDEACFDEQVLADALQAADVDEVGSWMLPGAGRRGAASGHHRDDTVAADGDRVALSGMVIAGDNG